MEKEKLDSNFWNLRYITNATGWDMKIISPPLKAYFDQLTNKTIKVLIPGAGFSYEAKYLSDLGFSNITIIDIAPELIKHLRKDFRGHENVQIIEGNFFELDEKFDLIIEQAFFCAFYPEDREKIVKKWRSLLSNNGKVVGLLFDFDRPSGPPFGGNKEEYESLISKYLIINTMERCYNSHPARQGNELWISLNLR